MSDEKYIELAIAQARVAIEKGNWPVGCVIVLDGKIVAEARNLVYPTEDRLAHAELIALKAAQPFIFSQPGKAILYTNHEPCPMKGKFKSRKQAIAVGLEKARDKGLAAPKPKPKTKKK